MINIVKGDRTITYTEEKNFTPQHAADLFLSVLKPICIYDGEGYGDINTKSDNL